MDLKETYQDKLISYLNLKLKKESELSEIIKYALLPGGKFFRPLLTLHMAKDLSCTEINDVYQLAHFCELHHAYTLIHDDLPSMDNDEMRRGKPSTHKKYGEGEAILAGDALLNMSYEALSEIKTNLNMLLSFITKFMGHRGLILGQFLDINIENSNLSSLLYIHKLKTARLIQVPLLGVSLLSKDMTYRRNIDLLKMGEAVGILFQLLDDLSELKEDLPPHETKINIFLKFNSEEIFSIIKKKKEIFNKISHRYHLDETQDFINTFINASEEKIKKSEDIIIKKIKNLKKIVF